MEVFPSLSGLLSLYLLCILGSNNRVALSKCFLHSPCDPQIRCSLTSDDRLYEVIERETCSYSIIIHTSLLCGHPLFDTGRRGRTQTLTCSPLLSQPDYQKYLDEQGKVVCEAICVRFTVQFRKQTVYTENVYIL